MDRPGRRRTVAFRPRCEHVEGRLLLSTLPLLNPRQPFRRPLAVQAVRPNTPVLPYGATAAASFLDPSAGIVRGEHVGVGFRSFVGPYARLDASGGFIKIGSGSNILDAATIVSTPGRARPVTNVLIGDFVSVGFGATVLGPGAIGAYGKAALPTAIGPGALIVGAVVSPGAIVGPLARVGAGVTVPTGMYVLPGANVTTNAEAANSAFGKVAPITAAQAADLAENLANNQALAAGYTALYQGNPATGVSPGVPASRRGVNNGDLAAVEGAGNAPGQANGVDFGSANPTGPTFLGPRGQQLPGLISTFRARITGQVAFHARADDVAHGLGFGNAIRADQGQPITFGAAPTTGDFVVINSPLGGADDPSSRVTINEGFSAGDRAMVLGGPGGHVVIGSDVSLGAGSILDRSSVGAGSTIGTRAYIARSNLPAGSVVPPGAIIINNQRRGTVLW